MALPPGFLDELRDRTSLSAVVGRKVTWDLKKSNQAKGDWWAPCPFHQEKTASFHVDDQKGFYYCFGCQAKGNVFSFLTETENMPFMEAVEQLARDAGMQMPARDPQAAARAEKKRGLSDIMEQAVSHYRLALSGARGRSARDYLSSRGLSADTIERFEIGFAADNRSDIIESLKKKGASEAEIIACGLAIKPDDGGAAYDRFRGRIMFPIRDARGRCISFGGRAMDPNARAKYLNGPETELFDKGRSLYNLGPAREAAGKTGRLIVAEGYMDVIALAQAGFGEALAPLGTAVTEDQLQLLWRVHSEPVIALDGDAAGLRAARKVMDLALPHLSPERALRFLILPQGQDPDDLIRAEGPGAFETLLDTTKPLVDLLWERETEGKTFDSPERRAALDASLRKALGKIPDQNLRRHYGDAIREKRAELFGQNAQKFSKQRRFASAAGKQPNVYFTQHTTPRPETLHSELVTRKQELARETEIALSWRPREIAIAIACFYFGDECRELDQKIERLELLNHDVSNVLTAIHDEQLKSPASLEDLDFALRKRHGTNYHNILDSLKLAGSHPIFKDGYTGPTTPLQFLSEAITIQMAMIRVQNEIREELLYFSDLEEDQSYSDEENQRSYERLLDVMRQRDELLHQRLEIDDLHMNAGESDKADFANLLRSIGYQ